MNLSVMIRITHIRCHCTESRQRWGGTVIKRKGRSMNRFHKLILIVLTLTMVLSVGLLAFPTPAKAASCGSNDTAPIITINSVQEGSITSYNSPTYLYVQFNTGGTCW